MHLFLETRKAQENISSTIDRGRVFLLLAGSIGIVLAAVALAMASHLFAMKQNFLVLQDNFLNEDYR